MKIAKGIIIGNVLLDQDDRRFTKLDTLSVNDIKYYLEQLGQDSKGRKDNLLQRLKQALSEGPQVRLNDWYLKHEDIIYMYSV